jgi:hypothetical protein
MIIWLWNQNHEKNFIYAIRHYGCNLGLKGLLWSLAQYAYAQWAGLYENLGRYVYVNRGFGFPHACKGSRDYAWDYSHWAKKLRISQSLKMLHL